jgi:hypothetical protein
LTPFTIQVEGKDDAEWVRCTGMTGSRCERTCSERDGGREMDQRFKWVAEIAGGVRRRDGRIFNGCLGCDYRSDTMRATLCPRLSARSTAVEAEETAELGTNICA